MKSGKSTILMLGPQPPVIGGISTHIQQLIHSPLKESYDFEIVQTMSRLHGTERYHHENVIQKFVQILKDWGHLAVKLMQSNVQLVHINTSLNAGAFWRDSLYLLTARLFFRPVFLQIHGGQLEEFLSTYPSLLKRLILHILSRAQTISVLSQWQYKPFAELSFSSRIVIVPNMIDADGAAAPTGKKVDDCFNILVVASHLTRSKGVYDALDVMLHLKKTNPSIKLIMIGRGEEEAGIESFIHEHGLGDRIELTGFVDREKIQRYLEMSHLFLLPSHTEGFPMVVLEAMRAGLPVVSTRVGAVEDMIAADNMPLLVEIGDIKGMVHAVELLMQAEDRRLKVGGMNYDRVKTLFNQQVVSDRFMEIYMNLIKGSHNA